MSENDQDRYELFDPLEEIDFENPQDETDYVEYVPPIEKPEESEEQEEKPLVPAPERIAAAIEGMPGERKLLLHIIDYCRTPHKSTEVMDEIASFRGNRLSIYDPDTVCAILEQAGALEMVYDGDPDAEPETYVEDGVEYLKIEQEDPEFSYQATADGIDAVEDNDPLSDFERMLDEDERTLTPIFARVLERCTGDGLVKKDIDAFVDKDPLVQEPRRYSGFFIDKLEEADALKFSGGRWITTQVGEDMLASGALNSQKEA